MVPDDLTVRIFERHLMILEMQELLVPEQHTLILDGLPRSYAQAERLDSILDVVQIFHLKIDDTVLAAERLRARALRENRLDDMSDEVIHRRLQTYYDETFQTLSFYPSELIFDVDAGRRTIDVLLRHRQPTRRDQETLNQDHPNALESRPFLKPMEQSRTCRHPHTRSPNRLTERAILASLPFSPTSRTRPSCPS